MRYLNFILLFAVLNFTDAKAQKIYDLKTVTVMPHQGADTVFGTWKFSVADYEFQEDKLVLLTFEKSLLHAKIMLTDASQKIISSIELPDEAKELYTDYLGYINALCTNNIYRIKIINNTIQLASLPVDDFKNHIVPCIDTIDNDIYFSNYHKDYPAFTYYAFNTASIKIDPFKTVCDKEQLAGYNMEYYFLKPRDRLYARRLADEYAVDKHRIAAIMSGLTSSIFYSPLYAPLFVVNDTVIIFDHCSNAILKYDKNRKLLDSISINYNHPQKWREWKHKIIVDKETGKTYALYQKNGFYYLKHIDLYSGKIIGSFKLSNQYVDKIKIKNNCVYYIYRPFESLQEQFVYKELIKDE